jgi:hypothetical protein
MKLALHYPDHSVGFDIKKDLRKLPNKYGQWSGYYMLAFLSSYFTTANGATNTIDRYVCFTNEIGDQVWIEKLGIIRAQKWFAFDDTRKIDNDEEFNNIYNFLKERKILE